MTQGRFKIYPKQKHLQIKIIALNLQRKYYDESSTENDRIDC